MTKNKETKRTMFAVIVLFAIICFFSLYAVYKLDCIQKQIDLSRTDSICLVQPEFLLEEKPSKEALSEALVYYDIAHPKIVYAQAILETGYFRSDVCLNYNNLFGLYNSKINDYMKFNHWSESVKAYKEIIQSKYNGEQDYFQFLTAVNYATDSLYNSKLQSIVSKLDKQ